MRKSDSASAWTVILMGIPPAALFPPQPDGWGERNGLPVYAKGCTRPNRSQTGCSARISAARAGRKTAEWGDTASGRPWMLDNLEYTRYSDEAFNGAEPRGQFETILT